VRGRPPPNTIPAVAYCDRFPRNRSWRPRHRPPPPEQQADAAGRGHENEATRRDAAAARNAVQRTASCHRSGGPFEAGGLLRTIARATAEPLGAGTLLERQPNRGIGLLRTVPRGTARSPARWPPIFALVQSGRWAVASRFLRNHSPLNTGRVRGLKGRCRARWSLRFREVTLNRRGPPCLGAYYPSNFHPL
jgi:hypothetical protein